MRMKKPQKSNAVKFVNEVALWSSIVMQVKGKPWLPRYRIDKVSAVSPLLLPVVYLWSIDICVFSAGAGAGGIQAGAVQYNALDQGYKNEFNKMIVALRCVPY